MISLNKLLRISFLSSLTAIIFLACNKTPEKKEYVARVNDSYLTEEEIIEADSLFKNSFSRNELVKRWVDNELLYQEAVRLDITDEEEYRRIINDSRKELAVSLLVNKYLNENLIKPGDREIEEFYDKHKDKFKASEDIYVYNTASFSSENAAIKFRVKAVETNWEKTIESVLDDKTLITHSNARAASINEIYPIQLINLIKELNPGELSIVLEENLSKYSLIQLMQIICKHAVPPLEIIKDKVEARYVSEIREKMLSEYLKQLHSNNKIEIKEK